MKEAMMYTKLPDKKVRCNLCGRRCNPILPDRTGYCRVRKNVDGKLYSLNYGKVCSIGLDPIEKKPLFHFWPGSTALSIATVGCNFRCQFCCNWQISQEKDIVGEEMTPEQIVELARKYGARSISYTYTEPTIFFELAYDTAKVARRQKIHNTFVTNGYTTPEAIKKISKYLDAATVDFKGSANPQFYLKFSSVPDVQPLFDALLEYKRQNIFLEITNLLIPEVGDDLRDVEKLVKWIYDNLGDGVPLHFIRFFPNNRMMDVPPTPVETMAKARKIAKDAGMKYVYTGNMAGNEGENTYCPSCGKTLIARFGFDVNSYDITENKTCPKCGTKILIEGEYSRA